MRISQPRWLQNNGLFSASKFIGLSTKCDLIEVYFLHFPSTILYSIAIVQITLILVFLLHSYFTFNSADYIVLNGLWFWTCNNSTFFNPVLYTNWIFSIFFHSVLSSLKDVRNYTKEKINLYSHMLHYNLAHKRLVTITNCCYSQLPHYYLQQNLC